MTEKKPLNLEKMLIRIFRRQIIHLWRLVRRRYQIGEIHSKAVPVKREKEGGL